MTDWAALFWLKSSFNMHDKRHPSGTFPANSTKSPDKLLFVSSSCHRQQRARFHQSTKAKLSTFDGPSSRFKICSLCAQWAQNKKGQTVQVLGCWNGALTQYYLPYLSCIELFAPLFYVFIVFFSNHHRARTKSCSEEYRADTKQPENSHNGEFSLGNHSCKAKTWISKQPFYYKWLNKFPVFQVKFMNWIIMYAEPGQILMYWWLHGKCQWTKWSRDVQKMETKTKRKAKFLATYTTSIKMCLLATC